MFNTSFDYTAADMHSDRLTFVFDFSAVAIF